MSSILIGRVVVVTGGAGRLGKGFASVVAQNGGTAVVCDTAADPALQLAEALCEAFGPRAAIALPFDITRRDEIDRAIQVIHQNFGRIDALVNNAYPRNSRYGAKLEDVSYEDFCENLGLHLGGYFLTAQRFAKYFEAQGSGNIVNLGSIYGTVAPRFEIYNGTAMTMPVEYAAIKAGVIQLTRYFAQYFKSKNIRVNALSPGGIYANQPESFVEQYAHFTRGGKMLEESDLHSALLFLLSDGASHMTGQNLVIDDGWTL